ncbi:DMT family transporter [Desulfatiferula olefinivorans]
MNPYLAIVTAAVIFGSSGVFIKTLALPVSTLTFFRMAVPFTAVTVFFALRKKPFPSLKDPTMLLASLLNAARLFFYFAGYAYGTISTTVILLFTWPVFAAFFSRLFLGERLTLRRLVLFGTTVAGVVLITVNQILNLPGRRFAGSVFILASALIYSLTIVMFKKRSTVYDPLETLWFQNGFGTFAFLPFLFFNRPVPLPWQVGMASIYAALIGVLGFGLFFFGLRRIEASSASFLTYIELVSGVAFGVILFHEELSFAVLAGGSLILGSALALTRCARDRHITSQISHKTIIKP